MHLYFGGTFGIENVILSLTSRGSNAIISRLERLTWEPVFFTFDLLSSHKASPTHAAARGELVRQRCEDNDSIKLLYLCVCVYICVSVCMCV